MPNEVKPTTLAEMAVQTPLDPDSDASARARFFNAGNAFNIVLDPVPDMVFNTEIDDAMAADAKTGFLICDNAQVLGTPTPATSPLLLARYARINSGNTLEATFNTEGSIWYVIKGSGTTRFTDQAFQWAAGDIFILPGGATASLTADNDDAVLWVVTNEPQMDFQNVRVAEARDSAVDIVHYPAAELDRQIETVYKVEQGEDAPGIGLILSSEKQQANRNVSPTMVLGLNTLAPGKSQRAHRHNSVAVSLVVEGEDCYSVIDGVRKDWAPYVTTVTPPVSYHSHHNKGNKLARFLIVQDGGIYYHARTMGFSFD